MNYDSYGSVTGSRCLSAQQAVIVLNMRSALSLFILLVCSQIAHPQTEPGSSKNTTSMRQPAAKTYSDTLRSIKKWVESEESDDLVKVLKAGDIRPHDLLAACHSSENEIASAAFLALQFLGKSECEPCAASISQMDTSPPVVCSAGSRETDYQRIEMWLAKKRAGAGYECSEDFEPLTPMDDSVIYALILDGSPRSRSILDNMLVIEKTCTTEVSLLGEVLDQAPALVAAAQKQGHNLRIEPDKLGDSLRTSAFFLPREYRKDSEVEVVFENKAHDRILLEVSYHCGNLCGRTYYVVIRKDGNDWHYDLIRMYSVS